MRNILSDVTEQLKNGTLPLPRIPGRIEAIVRVVQDDNSSMADITKALATDTAAAARVMQVANSAWHWSDTKVTTLHAAVARLGLRTVYLTLLGFGVRDAFRALTPACNSYLTYLWSDALRAASLASVMAKRTKHLAKDTAFLAGLMVHVGKLPLVAYYERSASALEWNTYLPFVDSEGGKFGRLVLAHWDFPDEIIDAVGVTPVGEPSEGGLVTYRDLVVIAKTHTKLSPLDFNMSPAAQRMGMSQADIGFLEAEVHSVYQEVASAFI